MGVDLRLGRLECTVFVVKCSVYITCSVFVTRSVFVMCSVFVNCLVSVKCLVFVKLLQYLHVGVPLVAAPSKLCQVEERDWFHESTGV